MTADQVFEVLGWVIAGCSILGWAGTKVKLTDAVFVLTRTQAKLDTTLTQLEDVQGRNERQADMLRKLAAEVERRIERPRSSFDRHADAAIEHTR